MVKASKRVKVLLAGLGACVLLALAILLEIAEPGGDQHRGSPAPTAASPGASAPKKPKRPKEDPSAAFFAALPVVRLEIDVGEPELSDLLRDERTYVRSTVRELDAGGGAVANVYRDVGIHLKGARGSYRPFHSTPALSLNFDKFTAGQKFHGIDKLHLNNSVQDPSYLCEFVTGELFRAAGVPAARVAFALVTLNNRPRGLYVLKEGFDRTFLSRHFADRDGNLYDGGFLSDIDEPLRRTSGAGPGDHSDLARLAEAASELDPARRLERLEAVLDLDRFLSFIAVEVLTWHWDGYAMKSNNYRIYHDPASGRFVFLPHGMDQMFGHARGPIVPDAGGLVARAVLSTAAGRERYLRRLGEIVERIFVAEDLTRRIDDVAPIVRAALAELGEDLDGEKPRRHDAAVAELRSRVADRAQAVREILAGAEPEPPSRGRRRRDRPAWEAQRQWRDTLRERVGGGGATEFWGPRR